MKTAIITGANGFIGSHVVIGLLLRGWNVHALGRSNTETLWEDRLKAALAEAGNTGDLQGLYAHEADLLATDFNPIDLLREVAGGPSATLVHVAGDTQFKPADPELQRELNVHAPVRLIRSLRAGIGRVVHVSTAYVAGKRTGLIRENDLDEGQGFWNSYEKSKLDAEVVLRELCRQLALPLVVVRPSIIINDWRTGRASTFTHLNAMVEVVSRIQDYYGLADGQAVSKVIRVAADPAARPNLAPVDAIVPALLDIIESPVTDAQTFHLCHPRPQTNAEVMDLIREAFQVKGLLALEFVSDIPKPVTHTEEMIFRSLRVYAPYLNNRCEFDVTNTRAVVNDYDALFSPIDVPYLQKVIAFERHQRRPRHRRVMGHELPSEH